MGFGLVSAGFILLFNPVINVFDVIPDAIGFFLIAAGLTKLSYFVDDIAKARSMFMKLAFVELAKIASIFLIVGEVNSGSTKVLLSFIFSLAEAAMFVPAVLRLFEGLSFSGLKYNGSKVSEIKVKNNGRKTDVFLKTRNYIIFFYIFRCIATLLPELTELQMYNNIGEVHSYSRPLTDFKPPLYKLLGFAVVVLGIIYIIRVVSYFTSLKKDNTYRESFKTAYSEALETRPSLFLSHRMISALMLFIAAAFLSYTLLADGVNILVGAISAAFFAASAFVMHRYVPKSLIILPFAVVRGALAVISFISEIRYFNEYSVDAVDFVDKAAAQYYRMAFIGTADKAMASALLIVYCAVVISAIREHLKVCGILEETAQYSKSRRDKETLSLLKRKLITAAVLGTLYFASSAAYRYLAVDHPVFIAVFVALSIIFIAYTVYAVVTVNEQLYGKETEMV